jgi:hypothetical protein
LEVTSGGVFTCIEVFLSHVNRCHVTSTYFSCATNYTHGYAKCQVFVINIIFHLLFSKI